MEYSRIKTWYIHSSIFCAIILTFLAFGSSACSLNTQSTENTITVDSKAIAAESVKQTQVKEAVETMMANAKATETAKPTATATETPVPTPTTTLTPTIEIEPTVIPLEINTNLDYGYSDILLRVEKLKPVSIEDIESGRYTQNEQRLLIEGKIQSFSKEILPLPQGFLVGPVDNKYFSMFEFDPNQLIYFQEQFWRLCKRPYKIVDMAMLDLDGNRILIIGVMHLNNNGSVSFLHYGVQDYKNSHIRKMINEQFSEKCYDQMLVPVFSIFTEEYYPVWEPYFTSKLVVERFVKVYQGPDLTAAANEWGKSGNIPDWFQEILWYPGFG